MTRNPIIYLLLFLLVVSCNKGETVFYTIKGNADYTEEEIVVFGIDSRLQRVESFKTDKSGNFSYTIDSDTIVPFIMVMPDGKQISLFAERGVKAELFYDSITHRCRISNAGPVQTLHDSISQVMDLCQDNRKKQKAIEDFIEEHPVSEVNIELLRRYFINTPEPDYQLINNLISRLGGILQDNEYLAITKKNIDSRNVNALHRQFPSFTYFTADSCKEITPESFNKKHLLITLWASWDEESRKQMKFLREVDKKVKSENFEILNIALEHDTIEWKRVVENDSITGINVCEKMAWNSEIAKKFKIASLPYSVLVNPYQRIIRIDVDLEKDIAVIDSIVTRHDKSVKEREEREKREKELKERKKKKKK